MDSPKKRSTFSPLDISSTSAEAVDVKLCSVCNDLLRCDLNHEQPIDSQTALRPLRTVRTPERKRTSLRLVPGVPARRDGRRELKPGTKA
jgi:hypothetical protein